MNFVLQKIVAMYNISRHLLTCRKVITNPLRCSRLFMERTPDSYSTGLRFGPLRFTARKEDMSAVREVLVEGGYDFLLPFLHSLSAAPAILDCGANIGSFGLRLLKERPDARIVSIEAAADTYGVLAANQRSNPWAAWTTVHAALWKSDGAVTLKRSAVSVMHSVQEAAPEATESVLAYSLASIRTAHGLKHIHVLKMDIEGAETSVIPAAADRLDADVVIIELHKSISDPRECCRVLAQSYPCAYVSQGQYDSPTFPNVVYYLAKQEVAAPGMVKIDLLKHLASVFKPEQWGKA